jgi:hypothetical protein
VWGPEPAGDGGSPDSRVTQLWQSTRPLHLYESCPALTMSPCGRGLERGRGIGLSRRCQFPPKDTIQQWLRVSPLDVTVADCLLEGDHGGRVASSRTGKGRLGRGWQGAGGGLSGTGTSLLTPLVSNPSIATY